MKAICPEPTPVAFAVTSLICIWLTLWGCSSTNTNELESAAVLSIERVDSLAAVSFVSAHFEMQRFTELIHQLQKRDSNSDWVEVVLSKAKVEPSVLSPLRYNLDPARQYAMLAKAETGPYHLAALWNLVRVPLWEANRANKYLMEGVLAAGSPDLAIEVLAMIPPNDQRAVAIEATSGWLLRQSGDSAVAPSELGLSLLVELALEIRPLPQRTAAIIITGSLLESLGHTERAQRLRSKVRIADRDETENSLVASTALQEIINTIGAAATEENADHSETPKHRWTETIEANELLRSCKTDSQRVEVLVELAVVNFEEGRANLALQQLDVAQMFLQLLDNEQHEDYIKEKLLEAARLYAEAGQLESALLLLTDRRLAVADTWISLTLTDIATSFDRQNRELQGADFLSIHQFILDEIINYGL